jgi:predicted nucleotidyltransferase
MCDNSQLEIIKQAVVHKARQALGDRLVGAFLYGSYARGDYDEDSDIDMIILADVSAGEANRIERSLISFTCGLDLEYDVLISLHVKDKATFDRWVGVLPYYQNIAREGVSLIA